MTEFFWVHLGDFDYRARLISDERCPTIAHLSVRGTSYFCAAVEFYG